MSDSIDEPNYDTSHLRMSIQTTMKHILKLHNHQLSMSELLQMLHSFDLHLLTAPNAAIRKLAALHLMFLLSLFFKSSNATSLKLGGTHIIRGPFVVRGPFVFLSTAATQAIDKFHSSFSEQRFASRIHNRSDELVLHYMSCSEEQKASSREPVVLGISLARVIQSLGAPNVTDFLPDPMTAVIFLYTLQGSTAPLHKVTFESIDPSTEVADCSCPIIKRKKPAHSSDSGESPDQFEEPRYSSYKLNRLFGRTLRGEELQKNEAVVTSFSRLIDNLIRKRLSPDQLPQPATKMGRTFRICSKSQQKSPRRASPPPGPDKKPVFRIRTRDSSPKNIGPVSSPRKDCKAETSAAPTLDTKAGRRKRFSVDFQAVPGLKTTAAFFPERQSLILKRQPALPEPQTRLWLPGASADDPIGSLMNSSKPSAAQLRSKRELAAPVAPGSPSPANRRKLGEGKAPMFFVKRQRVAD